MNKGLFAHIITTVIYITLESYVIGDAKTNVKGRFYIVAVLLFFNLLTAVICEINDLYKKKI